MIYQIKSIYDHSFCLNEYNEHNIYCAFQNEGIITYKNDKFYDSFNNNYELIPTMREWKGHSYFANYYAYQYDAVAYLIDMLSKELNIDFKKMVNDSAEKVTSNFVGTCGRSNINDMYYDVTPAFTYEQLYLTEGDLDI